MPFSLRNFGLASIDHYGRPLGCDLRDINHRLTTVRARLAFSRREATRAGTETSGRHDSVHAPACTLLPASVDSPAGALSAYCRRILLIVQGRPVKQSAQEEERMHHHRAEVG